MARKVVNGATLSSRELHISPSSSGAPITNPAEISRPAAPVVVIGGANVDIKSRIHHAAVLGTSNPGVTVTRAGGVGRNVAENLARLGVETELVTAFGSDVNGDWLRLETEAAGVSLRYSVVSPGATGSYSAILDRTGELVVAVSAMDVLDAVTPQLVDATRELIASCALLVLDCNLREETLVRAAAIAREARVRVLIDTVSVPKAVRSNAVFDAGIHVHTITPNLAELEALTRGKDCDSTQIVNAAAALHERGATHVWIRRGDAGSLMSSRRSDAIEVEEHCACEATVVDVTGAGDAMLAGYAAALSMGFSEHTAVAYGHAAAAITVESAWTVSPDLRPSTLVARVDRCEKSAIARRHVADKPKG